MSKRGTHLAKQQGEISAVCVRERGTMKELILKKDINDKIVTTSSTKWKDVIKDDFTIIFCVGKNSRKCYIAQAWDKSEECELITPYYNRAYNRNLFENLYELQMFYNVILFNNLQEIECYMEDNGLTWGEGGN